MVNLTSSFLLALVFSFCKYIMDWNSKMKVNNKVVFDREYDFIIVGGGTAGCVLANRLSEDPRVTVLLLEEGGLEEVSFTIPLLRNALYTANASYLKYYYSQPQYYVKSNILKKPILLVRGKVIGGTGSVNGIVLLRGNKEDYDLWEENGAIGWKYKNVLPYFERSETLMIERYKNTGYRGNSGPLLIQETESANYSVTKAFLEAGKIMGYEAIDLNGKNSFGFMPNQGYFKKGRRWSTSIAYLYPAMKRSNLFIVVNAHVKKVMFCGKRAFGVKFIYDGEEQRVYVKKEVILSAGALSTPKILMLSGVGPEKELEKFQIPVESDLPVGQNLQDHPKLVISAKINTKLAMPEGKSVEDASQLIEFLEKGTGIYSVNVVFGQAKIKVPYNESLANFQITLNGPVSSIKKDVDEIYLEVFLLKNQDRGSLTLRSTDSRDDPIINLSYLKSEENLRTFITGIVIAFNLLKKPPFQALGVHPKFNNLSECSKFLKTTENFLICYVLLSYTSGNHYAGSCKMGAVHDNSTVVDSRLRVKNLNGLRVVDASVMPTLTTSNTYATIVMIAEKAAAMIQEDWAKRMICEG